MIRVVAHISARAERAADLEALLRSLIEPTRQEAGCRRYELHVNNADPTDFTFIEEWDSDEALNAHLGSPHLQAAFPQVPELCTAMPDIRRYTLLA